ncbi:MAG TPA: YdaU family protein [Terracidiphilus sp.]|jgi:uncharacterized protein YdaU (DUF1376 family)|nr:YdaU family protein [Terracidiphilus sp.]
MTSTFNPKVDIFMPIIVGRYLQETADLDASESGAYLHLRMHLWINGPLPNDQAKLARIAKMPVDAWSIAVASVMHRFFLGRDGMYHHADLEAEKTRWMDKRQKAHDKAVKAARARWGKHKAKLGEDAAKKDDAPSIAHEMPYTSTDKVQKQKQPHPPRSTARSGHDSRPRPRALGTNPKALKKNPRSLGTNPRALGTNPRAAGRGEPKRKNGENAVNAPRMALNGHGDGIHPKNSGVSVATAKNKVAPGANGGIQPPKSDSRGAAFQREVFAYWKALNPEHPNCPWGEAEKRALDAFLIRLPDVSLPAFKKLLQNRAASGVPPGVAPGKWLRSLMDYSAGPLDRFHKPLPGPRIM